MSEISERENEILKTFKISKSPEPVQFTPSRGGSAAPMSRDEAIRLGLKRYFPLTPCERGHDSMRNTAHGYCLACRAEDKGPGSPPPKRRPLNDPRELDRMTRDEAIRLGLKRYTPLIPCERGHESKVNTVHGYCLACRAEDIKARRRSPAQALREKDERETQRMERREAFFLGLDRYSSVEPCPHCGGHLRNTRHGYCIPCRSRYQAQRRKAKPAPKVRADRFEFISDEAHAAIMAYARQWLEHDRQRAALDGAQALE